MPENERLKLEASGALEDHRPPKRPWEDLSHDGTESSTLPDVCLFFLSFPPFCLSHPIPFQNQTPGGDKPQSTAEQDMELIRTKRASSTAGSGAASGLPKSKYRKRSVRNHSVFLFLFLFFPVSSFWLSSGQVHPVNVIRVIFGRHRNGGVDLTARELCVMLVDCVSV